MYAKYGENLLKSVSDRLTAEFGKGFTYVNLTNMRKFYQQFPNVYALRKELTWTHYRSLIRVENQKQLAVNPQDYLMRDPVLLDFYNLEDNPKYRESDIETAINDNLQKFLLELGKGFSFVARQQRISTEFSHYYIDLVFYNYILKCFVLVDLKIGKLENLRTKTLDKWICTLECTTN
jgi:predicted nuclease of restriction endonuclease-like (RecB) superfamily